METRIRQLAEMLEIGNPDNDLCVASTSGDFIRDCWCGECQEQRIAFAAIKAIVKKTSLYKQL